MWLLEVGEPSLTFKGSFLGYGDDRVEDVASPPWGLSGSPDAGAKTLSVSAFVTCLHGVSHHWSFCSRSKSSAAVVMRLDMDEKMRPWKGKMASQ